MLTTILCVLGFTPPFATPAMSPAEGLKPIPLCRALESIEPGDQIPVLISGIYGVNYLYDPKETVCRLNVRPITCIEFSPSLDRSSEFDALHEEFLRVFVTFRGILHGRQAIPEIQNPSVPIAARVAAANSARYCSNLFDTVFIVESILSFGPVPDEVPWPSGAYEENDLPRDRPFPNEMALPRYPPAARALDSQGVVIVAVTVSAGEVTLAEVQFGDPVLIEETLANIRTWRFSADVNTSFSVEYEFRLEKRPMNKGKNPTIEMHLPFYVKVIGPSNDW